MSKSLVFCPVCNFGVFIENGAIKRAQANGLNLYCGRECAGVARRLNKTQAEKVEAKRLYDIEYRAKNAAALKAKKAAYYQANVDRAKEAEIRKRRMPQHIEYCRRPEYRAWKRGYDRTFRAKKEYGPFFEAALLVNDLNVEVLARARRYEIDLQNGKLNKSTKRKRAYVQSVGC